MRNSDICAWDPAEDDEGTEDSYVMHDGPIKTLMDDFLHAGDADGEDEADDQAEGAESQVVAAKPQPLGR